MKSIVIVGVGALGSHVVQFLRNADAGIKIIDFDRVEQKNVQAQFHAQQSVGKNKTVALAQQMKFLFGRTIMAASAKLTFTNDKELLKDASLVIDCLDNGASRRVVQGYVRANNVPCLHGALAADGSFGRVVWDENFVIDDETGAGEATCENGEHLPFIVVVSAYIARSAQEFLGKDRKFGWQISPGGAMRI